MESLKSWGQGSLGVTSPGLQQMRPMEQSYIRIAVETADGKQSRKSSVGIERLHLDVNWPCTLPLPMILNSQGVGSQMASPLPFECLLKFLQCRRPRDTLLLQSKPRTTKAEPVFAGRIRYRLTGIVPA